MAAEAQHTERPRGSTLDFLLRRMRRHADFPAISERISEISRKMANPAATSVSEIANTILSDYALTTKLLKLVNSSFYGHYGGRISTISRAVVILGFKRVRIAAQSLLLFEHIGDSGHAGDLRESAAQAQMSGVLGRSLARRMELAEPEEVFVCCMLRKLGRYLTVYYLPDEYCDIRRTMVARGADEVSAARSVLGMTYEDLGIGIARDWQLPCAIVDSMRALPEGAVETLNLDEPRLVSAFATELTDVLAAGGERLAARLDALQHRFGTCLPLEGEALEALLRTAADDAREYGALMGSKLTGSAAFEGIERWLAGKGAADGGDGAPRRASGSAQLISDPDAGSVEGLDEPSATVINGIQDITSALIEGNSLNDVLVMILETIFRGLKFTRVALCINDRKRGLMVARFALGQDTETLQSRLRFSYTGENDVFAKAVLAQADLIYPAPRCSREDLPSWYRKLVNPSTMLAMPIVVRGVCFGLIYCDRDGAGEPVGAAQLTYLNTLRNQAALAIKQNA